MSNNQKRIQLALQKQKMKLKEKNQSAMNTDGGILGTPITPTPIVNESKVTPISSPLPKKQQTSIITKVLDGILTYALLGYDGKLLPDSKLNTKSCALIRINGEECKDCKECESWYDQKAIHEQLETLGKGMQVVMSTYIHMDRSPKKQKLFIPPQSLFNLCPTHISEGLSILNLKYNAITSDPQFDEHLTVDVKEDQAKLSLRKLIRIAILEAEHNCKKLITNLTVRIPKALMEASTYIKEIDELKALKVNFQVITPPEVPLCAWVDELSDGNESEHDDELLTEQQKEQVEKVCHRQPTGLSNPVKFVVGDLLDGVYSTICHLVSADLAMSQGIALSIVNKFGRVSTDPKTVSVGDILIQIVGGCRVYHLVSKKAKEDKTTLEDLTNILQKLILKLEEEGITEIAMPRLGCGLDLLKWDDVRGIIETLFPRSLVSATVVEYIKPKEVKTNVAQPNTVKIEDIPTIIRPPQPQRMQKVNLDKYEQVGFCPNKEFYERSNTLRFLPQVVTAGDVIACETIKALFKYLELDYISTVKLGNHPQFWFLGDKNKYPNQSTLCNTVLSLFENENDQFVRHYADLFCLMMMEHGTTICPSFFKAFGKNMTTYISLEAKNFVMKLE